MFFNISLFKECFPHWVVCWGAILLICLRTPVSCRGLAREGAANTTGHWSGLLGIIVAPYELKMKLDTMVADLFFKAWITYMRDGDLFFKVKRVIQSPFYQCFSTSEISWKQAGSTPCAEQHLTFPHLCCFCSKNWTPSVLYVREDLGLSKQGCWYLFWYQNTELLRTWSKCACTLQGHDG